MSKLSFENPIGEANFLALKAIAHASDSIAAAADSAERKLGHIYRGPAECIFRRICSPNQLGREYTYPEFLSDYKWITKWIEAERSSIESAPALQRKGLHLSRLSAYRVGAIAVFASSAFLLGSILLATVIRYHVTPVPTRDVRVVAYVVLDRLTGEVESVWQTPDGSRGAKRKVFTD